MRSRILFMLFACALLFLFGACKTKTPLGPDPGNGQTGTLFIMATITLNGQPLADVEVYLSGNRSEKTISAADGSFSFSDLPQGIYYVTPSLQGYSFIPEYFEFSSSIEDLSITAQLAVFGADIGSIIADFTAKDQNNQNVSLYGYFGGVILVNFSADWCTPCQNEAGELMDLFNKYKDSGFQVITLLISGSPAEWAANFGLQFPVLDDLLRAIYNIYSTGSIPLNIVVGRNCNILYKQAGYYEADIEDFLTKFL